MLTAALDEPRLSELTGDDDGVVHRDEIHAIVARRLRERTTAAWTAFFDERRLWSGPVAHYDDLVRHPQVEANEMIVTIEDAAGKLDLYEPTHRNQIAAMADIYKQTISCISPRIMVKGKPLHLQNPDTQNRIRALLLAGIRSAILWKQLGGKRLQLLFARKRILAEAEKLLEQAI